MAHWLSAMRRARFNDPLLPHPQEPVALRATQYQADASVGVAATKKAASVAEARSEASIFFIAVLLVAAALENAGRQNRHRAPPARLQSVTPSGPGGSGPIFVSSHRSWGSRADCPYFGSRFSA
jgi:hypothetical protein